jgi:cytochrome c
MFRPTAFFAALTVSSIMSLPSIAAGDVAKGKRVFNKCKACHVADQEKNRIGPHLVGLFGRPAGSVEKFKYSSAMKSSTIVWNVESLDAYLKDPKGFVKGTRMVFGGLKKGQDRADLIAYLKGVSKQK